MVRAAGTATGRGNGPAPIPVDAGLGPAGVSRAHRAARATRGRRPVCPAGIAARRPQSGPMQPRRSGGGRREGFAHPPEALGAGPGHRPSRAKLPLCPTAPSSALRRSCLARQEIRAPAAPEAPGGRPPLRGRGLGGRGIAARIRSTPRRPRRAAGLRPAPSRSASCRLWRRGHRARGSRPRRGSGRAHPAHDSGERAPPLAPGHRVTGVRSVFTLPHPDVMSDVDVLLTAAGEGVRPVWEWRLGRPHAKGGPRFAPTARMSRPGS